MSKLNTVRKPITVFTHEGARAVPNTHEQELRRAVMACLLWEDNFYESGEDIAARITRLVPLVPAEKVADIAFEARTKMKLRHVPLLITAAMTFHVSHKHLVADLLAAVIQRPDEITEFLAIYYKLGSRTQSAQVKKGLAKAFRKFDEYQLAKYNRKAEWRLRDALFLCHAKPADVTPDMAKWNKAARAAYKVQAGVYPQARFYQQIRPDGPTQGELLFGKLVYDQLATPDTWEVSLSAGADKRTTFERLMAEKKLGALAFLRNLRNMTDAGVSHNLIQTYGDSLNWERTLPFRFIAAARVVPQLEHLIEPWMIKCLEGQPKLPGKTKLLVDVSGSMFGVNVSAKSDLQRFDAAAALAILLRELCNDIEIYSFSNQVKTIPSRRGFALRDALNTSQPHSSTYLGAALKGMNATAHNRLIVITDEQSSDSVRANAHGRGYMINVASYKNGVGYGDWVRITGWSEAIVDYIQAYEDSV